MSLEQTVQQQQERLDKLEKLLEVQSKQLNEALKGQDAVEILNRQHQYGFYISKCQYEEACDLFEEDGALAFHGGLFKGMAGIRRLFIDKFQYRFTNGFNGPIIGYLLDHIQLQPIITVADDRLSAKFRGRSIMTAGRHVDHPVDPNNPPEVPVQWWEGGIYENVFGRKSVNDPWRIRLLDYTPTWHSKYDEGWARMTPNFVPPLSVTYPEDPSGPDEIIPGKALWPITNVIKYHYPHPITGKWMPEENFKAITIQEALKGGSFDHIRL